MRSPITEHLEKCTGCSRCIRSCPVEEANVVRMEKGKARVYVDDKKCIACGACLSACRHGVRDFVDDTERFFADLRKGTPISVFLAPAGRANLENWGRILTLLKNMGVRKVYDVSLGADICIWAYIRYIQKNNPGPLITQPCPAIVTYILTHRPELLPYLSPVQSPMLCMAIYMRKYQGISDKLAALSPCVAKINEFADTGDLVSYNVTFVKLEEYIRKNKLALPEKESGFDHVDSGLGSIFPMPGGLRENVEFMLGQPMRIDKSEGQGVVYHSLDAFAREAEKGGENLPALFDVLNCPEGCNLGTACHHDRSPFEVDATMDKARCQAMKGRNRDYFDELYETYDKTFRLADFLRRYRPRPVRSIPVSDEVIEKAFQQMNKMDEASRTFDCGACGSDSCREMAIKVAKKINYADYCIQAIRTEIEEKQVLLLDLHRDNAESMQVIQNDIVSIKKLADDIVNSLVNVTTSFDVYESVTKGIDKIASNIHMISLNASIEAARAGEHGRSFAVVAEAIRDLASETQNATMKITATSADARKAVDGIAGRIVTIGGDITQAHDDISTIAEKTQKILHVDD